MVDENVTQPASADSASVATSAKEAATARQSQPTEPAQAPTPPTTDVSGQAAVEIPAVEPTPAPILQAEPVPAQITEPTPAVEPVPASEPVKAEEPAPTQMPEEPEIEIPEPAEQATPATQPQAVNAPVETKIEQKPTEPQIIEKIIYKEDPGIIRRLLDKAKSKIQERKRKKLDKIMSLFSMLPQVTNKDVQKSLRVIRRTATRYLDQLEKEGKITQVGKTGKSVIYTRRQ